MAAGHLGDMSACSAWLGSLKPSTALTLTPASLSAWRLESRSSMPQSLYCAQILNFRLFSVLDSDCD